MLPGSGRAFSSATTALGFVGIDRVDEDAPLARVSAQDEWIWRRQNTDCRRPSPARRTSCRATAPSRDPRCKEARRRSVLAAAMRKEAGAHAPRVRGTRTPPGPGRMHRGRASASNQDWPAHRGGDVASAAPRRSLRGWRGCFRCLPGVFLRQRDIQSRYHRQSGGFARTNKPSSSSSPGARWTRAALCAAGCIGANVVPSGSDIAWAARCGSRRDAMAWGAHAVETPRHGRHSDPLARRAAHPYPRRAETI